MLSHVSLNDNTVEGMRHAELPIFSVQYHPEASPGPNDAAYLFDRFEALIDRAPAEVSDEAGDPSGPNVAGGRCRQRADADVGGGAPPARAPRRALQRRREQDRGDARARGVLRARRQGLRRRRRAVRGAHGGVPRVVRAGAPVPRRRWRRWCTCSTRIAALPVEERRTIALLAASHRSLFELHEVDDRTMDLEDVLGGARFLVTERRHTIGFNRGDLFEARVISDGAAVIFGKTFIFHPADAREVALDGVDAALERGVRARGDPVRPRAPPRALAPLRPHRRREDLPRRVTRVRARACRDLVGFGSHDRCVNGPAYEAAIAARTPRRGGPAYGPPYELHGSGPERLRRAGHSSASVAGSCPAQRRHSRPDVDLRSCRPSTAASSIGGR